MRGKAQRTLDLERAIIEIVEERAPITVRGVCYGLFTLGLIPSMAVGETKKVSRIMTMMREEGELDWTLIVDGSRAVERISSWRNPDQIITSAVNSYRLDYWQFQPSLVEVWSEKSTVQGILAPVLDEYGVTFRVMKGFASYTAARQAAEDSLLLQEGQSGVVLYLGDWDPSGMYMSEIDLPMRLDRYGSEWKFQRIALIEDDLAALSSFDVKDKSGDVRFDWYVEHYGNRAWELDAMNPVDLRSRVADEIKSRLDMDAWEHAIAVEAVEIDSMRQFQDSWKSNLGLVPISSGKGC